MNVEIPGQPFNCPRCGAPGHTAYGGAVYSCGCRFGNYGRIEYTPYPAVPDGARPVKMLTEDDVRRIIREELKQPLPGAGK